MKIRDIFANKKRTLSFEFFPPKKAENEVVLFNTIDVLAEYRPDFVSVTYGAGGSTKDKTLDWTIKIKEDYKLNVMMHLTCVASKKSDVMTILDTLRQHNIDNILALRGDVPDEMENCFSDFKYAYQLVEFIKENGDFSIGVAGYPEGHTESPSLEKDIEYLKNKVDHGADFIITQLFFDNRYFFDFVNRARKVGINVPIIPGIMPIINLTQVERFIAMCGATIPARLINKMKGKSKEDMFKIGVDYAIKQCVELIENDVDGLHFYTLNKYQATKNILEELKSVL